MKLSSRWRGLGAAFVGLMLMSIAGNSLPGADFQTASSPAMPAVSSMAAQPAETPLPMPAEEQDLITAVNTTRKAYADAANEMAQGGVRAVRKKAICRAIPQMAVHNWSGRIADLSSNGEGKGVLAITLADGVTVATWNNALSDIDARTLIDASSNLFATASSLKVGDPVTFSGTFFADQTDCIKEMSMTMNGSMTDPDFLFRFSAIAPLR